MPEGDTIYRAAETLRRALAGREVTRFECRADPDAAAARPVEGRIVQAVEPRGKHLLMVFRAAEPSREAAGCERLGLSLVESDLILHTHLRMTGSWHVYRPGERWQRPERQAVVAIWTDAYVAPCFNAPVVELLTAREAVRHPPLTALGPDAMADAFDEEEALRRIRERPHLPVGVAVMNQRAMAGVGNVLKSEALFLCRQSPFTPVGRMPEQALRALVAECRRLLVLNREHAHRRTRASLSEAERLWVYGRSGRPCRVCGEAIRMERQGVDGRSTYYCPHCQAAGEG